jgi:hypothetical protein
MKNKLLIFAFISLSCLGSCKKYCYVCQQFCVRCTTKDSTLLYQACALNTSEEPSVQAQLGNWVALGYNCTNPIVPNQTTVCDNKNGSNAAVIYYENENYFCVPQ